MSSRLDMPGGGSYGRIGCDQALACRPGKPRRETTAHGGFDSRLAQSLAAAFQVLRTAPATERSREHKQKGRGLA